jgi:hypothetical protein
MGKPPLFTGAAGDFDCSNPDNWEDGRKPSDGDTIIHLLSPAPKLGYFGTHEVVGECDIRKSLEDELRDNPFPVVGSREQSQPQRATTYVEGVFITDDIEVRVKDKSNKLTKGDWEQFKRLAQELQKRTVAFPPKPE